MKSAARSTKGPVKSVTGGRRSERSTRVVLFDVDGVLLDSLAKHLKFCSDMAGRWKLGIPVPTPAEMRAKVAANAVVNPMKEFLRTVGFRDEYLDRADAEYKAVFATQYASTPFPGVDGVLKALKAQGIPMGLVTSNTEANVRPMLGSLINYFDKDLCSYFGTRKATAIAKVVAKLNIPHETCVFIGDVPTDKAAALEAGVRFLGVTYGWGLTVDPKYVTVDSPIALEKGIDESRVIPYPFDPDRDKVYGVMELWEGYDPDLSRNVSLDAEIFRYFKNGSKYSPRLEELRLQRRHDAGIEDAIDSLLQLDHRGFPSGDRKPVMILGSHGMLRQNVWYLRVAHLCYELTRAGFYVATGGGPGLMEAGNLGAYMANYSRVQLNEALDMMRSSSEPAPNDKRKQYEMPDYWEISERIAAKFPDGRESMGVPTWFYGHEGANRFALHVAKFLSNGLRESKMTSIGTYGAIFAPGGPGTSQEVFTDAAENRYFSFQWLSPMVFFNDPEAGVVTKMMEIIKEQTSTDYLNQDMLLRSNDIAQIVRFLLMRTPQYRERKD